MTYYWGDRSPRSRRLSFPQVVQFQFGRQANRHRPQRVNFELVFCSMLFGEPYRLGGGSVNNSGITGSRA
jgi:hypothetical protein